MSRLFYTPQDTPKRLFLILASFAMLAPLAIDLMIPTMPFITQELNLSAAQTNYAMSIFFGGVAIGQLVFGPLSDRIGRRLPILGGLTVYALGSIIAANNHSAEILLLARFTQALGACAVLVSGKAAVRDLYSHTETANYFSMQTIFIAGIPVISPFLATALIFATSWRAIFVVLAVIGATLLFFTVLRLKECRSEETARQARSEHPFVSYWQLLKQPKLLLYMSIGGFMGGAFFTYLASAPIVMRQIYNMPALSFSIFLSVNALSMVAASNFNRRLLKTYTPEQILRRAAWLAFTLAAIFGTIALTGFGGQPLLMAGMLLLLANAAFIQVNAMACALSVDVTRSGSTAALAGCITFAFGTVASMISGALFDNSSWAMAIVIATCCLITALLSRFCIPSIKTAQQT